MSAPMFRPKGTRPGRRAASPAVHMRTATDGRDILLNDPDGWEISEPWRWWEGPAGSDGTGGPIGNPPPGAGWPFGLPSAVTRCTSLIADVLAGMPWHVIRDRDRLPTPDWITDPQAKRIDQRVTAGAVPEWRRSGVEFWAEYLKSILWAGEGIAYTPNRDATGSPLPPLWNINPADVDIYDGQYGIRAEAGYGGEDEPRYLFAPGELIVTRGLYIEGERGVGVLQAHLRELMLADGAREFAFNAFRRGVPNGYLKVSSPNLTRPQAQQLAADWDSQHGGRHKRIAVLNAVTDFHPLQLDPQAMQLVQLRALSDLQIALAFGIPPYMIGVNQDPSTYANVEGRFREFSTLTLMPYSRRVESSLDAEFPRGTELKINLNAMLRAETQSRYLAYATGIQQGFLTVDEVRRMEDLPAMTVEQLAEQAFAAQQQQTVIQNRLTPGGGQ